MKRLSDVAYSCYADTLTPPNNTLLVVQDEVFLDIYKVLEAKRNRIRKFYKENFVDQEQTPKTSKRKFKRKKKD